MIVGFARSGEEPAEKRLFSYIEGKGEPIETTHGALTAYLFDAKTADRHLVVKEETRPLNSAPRIFSGSQPIDDGQYIFDANQRAAFLLTEPGAERFMRPYVGSEEFINRGSRWILALQDAAPADLRSMPLVRERMRLVREFRSRSRRKSTLAIAETPATYNVTLIPDSSYLVLPEVSSERRDYVPIGWLEPPIIPSNLVRVLPDATLWHFGILTSGMHMAWLRHIGGRLESRYRYSIGLVYNTFPWPDATPAQRRKIEALARAVLDKRALPKNATSSLADLYDPDTMPAELRKAHRDLDASTGFIARAPSAPTVSGGSICSRSTKRWSTPPPLRRTEIAGPSAGQLGSRPAESRTKRRFPTPPGHGITGQWPRPDSLLSHPLRHASLGAKGGFGAASCQLCQLRREMTASLPRETPRDSM